MHSAASPETTLLNLEPVVAEPFQKSRRSGGSGNCVEVAPATAPAASQDDDSIPSDKDR